MKRSIVSYIIAFLFFIAIFPSYKIDLPQKITISAIGDIMAHKDLQLYALNDEEKYLSYFRKTSKIFRSDDLTIGNLETPVCDDLAIKGFPCFNAKSSLIDAIRDSGIEVLSLANNHSYDQGIEGIRSTVAEVKKRRLYFSGTGSSAKEKMKPAIIFVKGITIGYISLTGVENFPQGSLKENQPYIYTVHPVLNKSFEEFCLRLRGIKKKVDVLIVSYHVGEEYESKPTEYLKRVFKKIADNGADVIIGHHPHVLQPIEYYRTTDNRNSLIAYSLGNFISSQVKYKNGLSSNKNIKYVLDDKFTKTSEGVILQFDIIKSNGEIQIVNAGIYPLFNLCFPKKTKTGYITGFQSTLIQDIISENENQQIRDLVEYRLSKIKKLINLPVKSYK